jgi:hypothetical protein
MAEVLTNDQSVPAEVMSAQNADMADSLRVGEELVEAHEQRLAGKYKNTEELEAAYLELQKKLGSQEENVQEESEEVSETDWLGEAYRSIQESGELSEELSKQISEMNGMDVFKAMQNTSNQSQTRDLTEGEVSSVYQAVGGEEAYTNMISWAQSNLSEAEVGAFDSIIESGDMNQINLAIQGLNSRYTDAVGQDGNLIQGKAASSQNTFRSQAELIQAMNDPRYDNDPAYRQDVIDKLDRSELQF